MAKTFIVDMQEGDATYDSTRKIVEVYRDGDRATLTETVDSKAEAIKVATRFLTAAQ